MSRLPWLSAVAFLCGTSLTSAQESKVILPNEGGIAEITFSPEMDRIAVRYLSDDPKTYVFAFPSLKLLGGVGKSTSPQSAQFSPCGKFLAIGNSDQQLGGIAIWDIDGKEPKRIKLLRHEKEKGILQQRFIQQIRFSADGQRLFAMDLRALHTWNWQRSATSSGEQKVSGGRWIGENMIVDERLVDARTILERYSFRDGQLEKKGLVDNRLKDAMFAVPYIAVFDGEDKCIYVYEAKGVDLKVVDKISEGWFETQTLKAERQLYCPVVAVNHDRSVIINYYGTTAGGDQGIGLFPRTETKRKEFGLDRKKHTHLYMPIPKETPVPPKIVFSPDGKWVAFTEVDLPPRIWSVATLGRDLLASRMTIEKR